MPQSNIAYTPKLRLPYINTIGQAITPDMERRRYLSLDVQLDALFSVLGNGVISGWEITTTAPPGVSTQPNSIYITAGSGHINSLACETLSFSVISNLSGGTSTFPGINYIYASTTDATPLTKEVHFFFSNTPLSQDNIIAIGLVTITGTTITINTADRVPIGFLSVLLASLVAHRHGKDGISAIDLASEVKGILASENIGDIPAEIGRASCRERVYVLV